MSRTPSSRYFSGPIVLPAAPYKDGDEVIFLGVRHVVREVQSTVIVSTHVKRQKHPKNKPWFRQFQRSKW